MADEGIARMRRLAADPDLAGLSAVWASDEAKAIEAAGFLAARFGLPVQVHPGLAEMDRSSTGYRPRAAFEGLADAFFARPEESVEGWERAVDAQRRVVAAATGIVARHGGGTLALVGHGGTGTLLMCAWAGLPIARRHDQPKAGCRWRFSLNPPAVIEGWQPIG
nr:histidine phosphatase family protein [Neoroseomonas alba]